jgi:hypothetical protein
MVWMRSAQTSINTEDENQYSSCSEPYMVKMANAVPLYLLSEKSKERYIMVYEKLLKFRKINKTKSSENVFLTNFKKLSTEINSSTLWSI